MGYLEVLANAGCSVSIPDRIWECESLKPLDIKLYRELAILYKKALDKGAARYSHDEEPLLEITQNALAKIVSTTTSTIAKCIERLEKTSFIRVRRFETGYKKTNQFVLSTSIFGVKKSLKKSKVVVSLESKVENKSRERANQGFIDKVRKDYVEKGGLLKHEKEVIAIADHYNMLARKELGKQGYRALAIKNPKGHKNWPYFEKLRNLCEEKDWDAKIYLEASFERARLYWKNIKFPQVRGLCSKKAQEYFVDYLEHKHKQNIEYASKDKKMRASKTRTYRQELIANIGYDINKLQYHMRYEKGERDSQELKEAKFNAIATNFESLSTAYLYTIPWARHFAEVNGPQMINANRYKDFLKEANKIDKNEGMKNLIMKAVDIAERKVGLPPNFDLSVLLDLQGELEEDDTSYREEV